MRICLDPGHGGKDPGACAGGLTEAAVAFLLARRAKEILVQRGHQVTWTRTTDDVYPTLAQRVKTAKAAKCGLFVSVHCNASGNQSVHGVEAFVAAGDEKSYELARKLLHKWAGHYSFNPLKLRGVKWDNQSQHSSLYVLQNTHRAMPAILVEAGFLTNPDDRMRMENDPLFGLALGHAIAAVAEGLEDG